MVCQFSGRVIGKWGSETRYDLGPCFLTVLLSIHFTWSAAGGGKGRLGVGREREEERWRETKTQRDREAKRGTATGFNVQRLVLTLSREKGGDVS